MPEPTWGGAFSGLAVGIPSAFAASRLLESLLFGIAPTDLRTYAALSAAILIVVCAATWVPAARAARIDPAEVIKQE